MQRLTHVPPSLPCSIRATFAPSWLALRAQPRPPEPPPITSRSRAARDAIFCSRFDERALKPSYTYTQLAVGNFRFIPNPLHAPPLGARRYTPQWPHPSSTPRASWVLHCACAQLGPPRGWGPRALARAVQRCRHGA